MKFVRIVHIYILKWGVALCVLLNYRVRTLPQNDGMQYLAASGSVKKNRSLCPIFPSLFVAVDRFACSSASALASGTEVARPHSIACISANENNAHSHCSVYPEARCIYWPTFCVARVFVNSFRESGASPEKKWNVFTQPLPLCMYAYSVTVPEADQFPLACDRPRYAGRRDAVTGSRTTVDGLRWKRCCC